MTTSVNITGARIHNLKNIDIEFPKGKLTVITGKSGSDKDNVYILDEPTTGLSSSDSERLIELMQELVDNGNTVIVTEHDPAMFANCNYIIEMEPGGGNDGGYVLATGTPAELKYNEKSIIGRFLNVPIEDCTLS